MKERHVFHKSYWFKVSRSLGYMMVPFLKGCDTLKGVPQALKDRWCFRAHLQQLKGFLGFTELIKKMSIGVAYGVLHTLVWIFKYVTNWQFAGPKGANFWDVKKFNNFLPPNFGILSHKWHRYVFIYEFMELFFCIWYLSYGRLSILEKNKPSIYSMKGQ